MALQKCPRCELNYILDGGKFCTVCCREMKGEQERDSFEMCSACNENLALPGKDLCHICLKEMGRTNAQDNEDLEEEAADLELGSVSNMEEIAMDVEGDIPQNELGEIDRELSLEEALEKESDEDEDEEESR